MKTEKLRALPLQLIELDDGILLKRGCTVLQVNGKGARAAVQTVLSSLAGTSSTPEEIAEKFPGPNREAARQLLEKLVAKQMLVSAEDSSPPSNTLETNLDIFYWHFGESTGRTHDRLRNQHIAILGVNEISRPLSASLMASGAENVEVVDYPLLRNVRLFNGEGKLQQWRSSTFNEKPPRNFQDWKDNTDHESVDCLVATSDFGGQSLLREWNQFCVDRKRIFLPVVLQDQVGYIGPLVVPGETACFECLLARQNSHKPDRLPSRKIEEVAYEGQSVVGFHPSMAFVLGDIAAFEIIKFFSGALPGWNVGTLIEINLLSTRMTPRKVLKVPRCPVCSPLITRSPTSPNKAFSLLPGKDKT